MSFLKKLFGKSEPKERTRICPECGMAVDDHKEWCTIRKGHAEMARNKAANATAGD